MATLYPTTIANLIRYLEEHPDVQRGHYVPDCNDKLRFIKAEGMVLVFEQSKKSTVRVPLTALVGTLTFDPEFFATSKNGQTIKYFYLGELPWVRPEKVEKQEVISPTHYFECEERVNDLLNLL
jgi:hypothetical protein